MKIDQSKFLNPLVSLDVVIFTLEAGAFKVLLIKRAHEPFEGVWALPGGFLFKGETAHDGVLRILKTKAGITNEVYVEQLYTFDTPGRDPRGPVFSVTYFALVSSDSLKIQETADTEHPKLVSARALPKLAFDHRDIIAYATARVEAKILYTNAVYSMLPRYFTFLQLQKVYETILNHPLDKRNFRKKFMELGLIKETKKMFYGGKQRPARLFEFISRKPTELKRFF